MKLLFASPSDGSPLAEAVVIGQRLAIMHAQKYAGVEWVGDCSPTGVRQTTIDTVRNRIVKEALQSQADAIFWCDSDIVLPPHAITALVSAKHDFVCGIYHQRGAPYYPVVARYDDTAGGQMKWFVSWPENVVAPIDACGFGVVLTSIAMLKQMAAPWFEFTHFSEDFSFCRKATAAGIQLYVHTACLCGHMGPRQVIDVETFRTTWQQGAWQDPTVALDTDSAA